MINIEKEFNEYFVNYTSQEKRFFQNHCETFALRCMSMMSEWISVKDELPENGAELLVSVVDKEGNHKGFTCCRYFDGFTLIECDWKNGKQRSPDTHWMPLPEPPND